MVSFVTVKRWIDTRIFVPVDIPVSLAAGHIRTGPFRINVEQGYSIWIDFDQSTYFNPMCSSYSGTLRYLLWIAALLTPRPPAVMVLNEPETSLHPDLLGALGRLIARAAERTQIIVVTHSKALIAALSEQTGCNSIMLEKHSAKQRFREWTICPYQLGNGQADSSLGDREFERLRDDHARRVFDV